MKANPGGRIDPDETLGRDELIKELWDILDRQSVYMNDLRRMGKTQVMVKMEAEPPPGWVVIKRDLEGAHSAEEFAAQVYRDAVKALPGGARLWARMGELVGKVAGTEIAGVLKLPDQSIAPWKDVLTRTLADLDAHVAKEGKRALLMWDEVPYLLDSVSKSSLESAGEILDVLRAVSQECKHLRLLLTGSIGLHHLLGRLRTNGYSGSPLNGMELRRVGPLSPLHGEDLARRLLEGEGVRTGAHQDEIAAWIAKAVGNVPYYVHKVARLLPKDRVITMEELDSFLDEQICSPDSDWDFAHYQARIDRNFGAQAPIVLALLDTLANARSLPFSALEREVRSQLPTETEDVRTVVQLLCKDHYLTKAGTTYSFYLEIVRRWWCLSRDLAELP